MHTCQFSWLPFSRLGTSLRLVSQVLNSPPDSVVMLSQPFWIHSISVGIGIAESEQLIQKRGLLPTVLDAVVTTPPHLLWEGPPTVFLHGGCHHSASMCETERWEVGRGQAHPFITTFFGPHQKSIIPFWGQFQWSKYLPVGYASFYHLPASPHWRPSFLLMNSRGNTLSLYARHRSLSKS